MNFCSSIRRVVPVLLIGGVIAAGAAGNVARATDEAALSRQVEALPAIQPWEMLKKATLEWAMEDARAAREQGFPDRCQATLTDVAALLNKEIGRAHKAPENLFPPIPMFDTNPYAKSAFGQKIGPGGLGTMEQLIRSNTRFAKGPVGNIISDATGWVAIRTAYEGEELVEALCHPQSPYLGDPRLIAPMFRRFENAYEYLVPGNKRVADFGDSPPETLMYLELKSVYPDLILPSRQVAWERGIRVNSDAIVASHEAVYTAAKPGTCYVNSDVKYTSALGYAGLLFPETKYTAVSHAGVRLINVSLYPDGGFPYINSQNENFTYHAIAVAEMTRLWQVTGNPLCRDIVEGTRNYYPLSIEPPGVAEYSTASCWKHYWHGATAGREAYIVAQLSGDPQDMRVALMNPARGDLLMATVYQRDIAPAPTPDNYMVYDRNIQGPRGRFGAFSFCGTARDYMQDPRGKSTYAGCMAVYPPNGAHTRSPLSAALDTAGTEVRVKPGAGADRATVLNLSQLERNATIVTRDFATVTTVHSLTTYGGKPTGWRQKEGWLFIPDRLVGLVSVEALDDQSAYGLNGVLQFLHAWNNKERPQEFQTPAGNAWSYGLLTTRIHDHSYPNILTTYSNDIAEPGKYARIVLSDQASGRSDHLISYAKGTKQYYLAEIYPQWAKAADQVSLLTLDNGLMGFIVTEGAISYRLVFNPTDADQTCRVALIPRETDLRLHHAGEQYRPAWIEPDGQEKTTGKPDEVFPNNGIVSFAVPAGSHVVLVSSSK